MSLNPDMTKARQVVHNGNHTFQVSHGEVSSPELQENGTLRFMQATVDSCRELHITPPKRRVWLPDFSQQLICSNKAHPALAQGEAYSNLKTSHAVYPMPMYQPVQTELHLSQSFAHF